MDFINHITSLCTNKHLSYAECFFEKSLQANMTKSVIATILHWLSGFRLHEGFAPLCKTITADNGFEFASISELETEDLQVFFAHPYAAWERGSNERRNSLLRRIILKGTAIRTVSEATLKRATEWCNTLPRKILSYRTRQEAFLEEVKKLVDLESVQFHITI